MLLKIISLNVAIFLAWPSQATKGDFCEEPVQTCLTTMVARLKNAGFIGVEIDDDKVPGQLLVTKVVEGSPAEKAGIQIGDELYSINGVRFNKKNHKTISQFKVPGKEVTCTVKRNGLNKSFKVTLVPMPADLVAKYIGEHMMEHKRRDEAEQKTAKK